MGLKPVRISRRKNLLPEKPMQNPGAGARVGTGSGH
jgi:hypothetical protein